MKQYILLLASALMCSCSSVLDVDPFGKILPKEYSHFKDLDNDIHLDLIPGYVFLEKRTDNVTFYMNQFQGYDADYLFNDNNSYSSLWNGLYSNIVSCNLIIDKVMGCSAPVQDKAYLKADALVVRANYYFYLANVFCWHYDKDNANTKNSGVPINLGYEMKEGGFARASIQQVYDQILSDLTEAEKIFLSFDKDFKRPNEYHHNLNSLYALLSRVYLYMGDWKNTIDVANKAWAINSKIISMTNIDLDNNGSVSWLDYCVPLYKFGSPYNVLSVAGSSSYVVDRNFLSSYSSNDKRLAFYKAMIAPDKTPLYGDFKYNPNVQKYSNPLCFIRNEEVLLNRAEAAARCAILQADPNALQIAVNDLNLIKKNRIDGYVDASVADFANPNDLLTEILAERRRELAFEGFRWFDLKRLGYPAIVHVWTDDNCALSKNDKRYVILIPDDEISANPLIVQNER